MSVGVCKCGQVSVSGGVLCVSGVESVSVCTCVECMCKVSVSVCL